MKKITLLFYLFMTALSADDAFDEKPFTVSSRAINVSRQAALEFEKMREGNIKRGVELLESALQEPSFKRLNVETQISIFLQLADGYHRQKEFRKEEEFLKKLLQNPLLEPYTVQLQSTLGLFYLDCNELDKAETILKALTKIHPKTLSQSDRDDIATLWDRLDSQYRSTISRAEKNVQQGSYQAACLLYEQLLRACERKAFPKTESQIVRRETRLKIHLRLGECYAHMQRYEEALHHLLELQTIASTPSTKELIQKGLFLLAYVQKQVHEYEAAELTIRQYLAHNQTEAALLLAYEIALATDNEELIQKTEGLLATPLQKAERALLQAKWCEENDQRQEAHTRLSKLFMSPVQMKAGLQDGLLLMKEAAFEEAAIRFEETLRQKVGDQTTRERTLKAAISCYIELAKRQNPRESAYLDRAQSCLEALREMLPEGTLLPESLQVALFRALLLQDKEALVALEKLDALLPLRSQHELIQLVIATVKRDEAAICKSALLQAQYVLAITAYNPEKLLELLGQEPSVFCDLKDRLRVEALSGLDQQAALESCQEFLSSYPTSAFRHEVLRLLAVLQLQTKAFKAASETLEQYLVEYPQTSARDQVLFLLAHARSPTHFEQTKALRKELVRDYPASPYAAESFFLQFSESEYQNGAPLALKHLEEFLQRYPENKLSYAPLKILASFYLGIHQKERSHLLQAYAIYTEWAGKLEAPFAATCRTIAEAALLEEGSLQSLIQLDENMDRSHPLFYKVKLQLAKSFSELGDEASARDQLGPLFSAGLKKQDFLLRAHLLLGQIEMKAEKFPLAIQQFDQAEGRSTGELLLEVRLAKSDCLQQMGKFDEAILLLSQIINDSTASQLRIKAMLKRAELYEGQKRYELAIKQLEAAECFPGEWGQRAKEKLSLYYDVAKNP